MSRFFDGFHAGFFQTVRWGLENDVLTGSLILISVLVLVWGFERYRTTFSRFELEISILIAFGLLVTALFPTVLSLIGRLLRLESRFLVVMFLSNGLFIGLILFLAKKLRENQTAINDLTRQIARNEITVDEASTKTIVVVIPAYNEADSVAPVITTLPARIREYDVVPLVVSDGSTDRTVECVASTAALVVEHPVNQGQGTALKTGFEIALERDADIIVTMDADGQHSPNYLSELVLPIIDDESDFVIGSRYRGIDNTSNGPVRSIGIRIFTGLINSLVKTELTDCTSGYRAIRATSLSEITLTEDRFNAPELIIEAKKASQRITEIPITIEKRTSGTSKKPKFWYAYGLTRTIFVTWLR